MREIIAPEPAAALGTLAAAPATVPDPRRPRGWNPAYPPSPLVAVLQVCVAAILGGARSLYAIAHWGREMRRRQPVVLLDLGVPAGSSPCVATLHRVFKALDVDALERAVGEWLARTGVDPDDALALDGKTLRGIHGEDVLGVHLVAAYAHRAEVVVAQLRTEGKGQEIAATKEVLAGLPLAGRVVTADALLAQREICEQIVAAEGDYLLPVEDNQPALAADIAGALSPAARAHAESDRRADPADLAAAPVGGAGRQPHGRRRRPGQRAARAV